jgi:UDP-glucose 4-epimerase
MELSGKKVFLTGGAGFIGSHLVTRFLKEGAAEVIIYDNFSTGERRYLKDLPITIIEGDILDYEKVKAAMKGCDLVSHHAAELEVFHGIEDSVHEMQVNIQGTLHVLNAAKVNGIEKFIYASSGGVYGQAQKIPEPIDHPLMPQWPYGVAKLAGEKYCSQYNLYYGLKTVSFRYGIVFGPHEWYGRVATLFMKRALAGQSPVIFGSGNQRRDFVYVDDVVEANILGFQNDHASGKVFNVGGISKVTIREIAETIIKIINPKLRPIYDNPKPGEVSKYQPDRRRIPSELIDFILDNSETTKILGYTPKIDIKTGFQREIEWLKENPDIWNYPPRV